MNKNTGLKNSVISKETTVKIFHISGLTEIYKKDMIDKLKKLKMFVIFDIDEETEKIYKLKDVQDKLKNLKVVKPTLKKKLEDEINIIWTTKLSDYIDKTITENENTYGIIFIGNIIPTINGVTKQTKNKIIIPCQQKFFLKVNLKQNAQEIIKFNLKKYHDDIVEGEFPLDYINLEYLIKTREFLQKSYHKNQYTLAPMDKILYYFETGINEKKPDILYVFIPTQDAIQKNQYIKFIENKKVNGYTEDWLALTGSITGIDQGYNDGIAYIKEKIKGSFNKLKIPGFIYVVQSTTFLATTNNSVKFTSDRKIKIIKSLKIENIYDKLKELKIKFMLN
jgi:hypothetical protein